MSILDGFVAKAALIRGASAIEASDALVYRILRDRGQFYSSLSSACDNYLRVFLAVDDSDPTAVPPTSISAARHNWAKSEYANFLVSQSTFIQDVKDYLKVGSGVVQGENPLLAELKAQLVGKTDAEVKNWLLNNQTIGTANFSLVWLLESIRSKLNLIGSGSSRYRPVLSSGTANFARILGARSTDFGSSGGAAWNSAAATFSGGDNPGRLAVSSTGSYVVSTTLNSPVYYRGSTNPEDVPRDIRDLHQHLAGVLSILDADGDPSSKPLFGQLYQSLLSIRDSEPATDTPVILTSIRKIADTIVDVVVFANSESIPHDLDIADFQ